MLLIRLPQLRPARRDRIPLRRPGPRGLPRGPERADRPEWAEYLFYRDNPKGAFAERWVHSTGCRNGSTMLRDTVTYDIQAVYPMGEPRRRHHCPPPPKEAPK